jgi:DNA-binding transcriptional LysR family regulator
MFTPKNGQTIMTGRLHFAQLKPFLAVVRTGGIGRAAGQLNLTQPAVTTRIKNL